MVPGFPNVWGVGGGNGVRGGGGQAGKMGGEVVRSLFTVRDMLGTINKSKLHFGNDNHLSLSNSFLP